MIRITDKKECCGCEACVKICPKNCISLYKDEYGFTYPVVDESKCINCSLCEKVCPMLNKQKISYEGAKVYGLTNKNKKVLKKSSSGGVFHSIAKKVIEDGGIVYGVDSSLNFISVNNLTDLDKILGSKYLQAHNFPFKEVLSDLKEEKKVLVSGTPCQIAALRLFLRKDFANLYTISFVCESVPSPVVFNILCKYYEKKYNSKIVNTSFRDKKYGWVASKYVKFTFANKKTKEVHLPENPFLKLFLSMEIARPSCMICKHRGKNSTADIIMSDFWNVVKSKNTKYSYLGVSQALFNKKGLELFSDVEQDFEVYESSTEEMKLLNKMFNDIKFEEMNNEFILDIKKMDVDQAYHYLMKNYAQSPKEIFKYKVKLKLSKIRYIISKLLRRY